MRMSSEKKREKIVWSYGVPNGTKIALPSRRLSLLRVSRKRVQQTRQLNARHGTRIENARAQRE